jgi:integrase
MNPYLPSMNACWSATAYRTTRPILRWRGPTPLRTSTRARRTNSPLLILVFFSPYWYYRFTRNGTIVYENTKQRNKGTAQEMESDHRTRLAKGETGIRDPKDIPTLLQFKDQFIEEIELVCHEKPQTIDFYTRKLKNLLKFQPLANQRLDRIDEDLIKKYMRHRRHQTTGKDENKRNISPASVNRELATLRRALRLAQAKKILDRVPKFEMLKGEHVREFVLSHEQESGYLASCPTLPPLRDIAALILDTGLRRGEALALQWPDVHLDQGCLRVREGKSKNAKRVIPVTQRVQELLRTRFETAVDDYVFSSGEGPYSPSYIDHVHEGVRGTLGKEFVIHSLRHTFGTRLGESGADAFTIMKLMGHSSITTSQRYVHPSTDVMQRAIRGMENNLCTIGAVAEGEGGKVAVTS